MRSPESLNRLLNFFTIKKMLQILFIPLAIFYLLMASCLFSKWLEMMQQDINIKPQMPYSRLLLVIVTILWPIVVPLAYLELLSKLKSTKESLWVTIDQIKDYYPHETKL